MYLPRAIDKPAVDLSQIVRNGVEIEINIRRGVYREAVTFSKRGTVVASGGIVTIGP